MCYNAALHWQLCFFCDYFGRFKHHGFALLYQGQPLSPLACAQGTLEHNICLSQTSAAFQLITSVFPRCFKSRRSWKPYWNLTMTFLSGFKQNQRESAKNPIMPDCYLWTQPPGKPLLRRDGWCQCAHLLSLCRSSAHTWCPHLSCPHSWTGSVVSLPSGLEHCLQRGSSSLKSSYTGSLVGGSTLGFSLLWAMSQPLNTHTDWGTIRVTQICFWAPASATEQSNCHCTRTGNSWMRSECQTGFKAPSELHCTWISI